MPASSHLISVCYSVLQLLPLTEDYPTLNKFVAHPSGLQQLAKTAVEVYFQAMKLLLFLH